MNRISGAAMRARPAQGVSIRRSDQLDALRSPLRQEIIDAISAAGPMTVAEVSHVLDRAPDSLYYHVRLLARVGLLDSTDRGRPGRRSEMLFDVRGRPLHILPQPGVAAYRSSLQRIVASMLSLARRQHAAALENGGATCAGPFRNLRASRVTGWLRPEDVRAVNGLLARANARFKGGCRRTEGRLLAFTFLLTPVVPTVRRASGASGAKRGPTKHRGSP
jgi:DNA-binding transcriptional ArsR family regulator